MYCSVQVMILMNLIMDLWEGRGVTAETTGRPNLSFCWPRESEQNDAAAAN